MDRFIKNILIIFAFILSASSFSQVCDADINLINFDSSSIYAPGSGVSIHVDPQGKFKMTDPASLGVGEDPDNNSFFLELSEAGGNFDSSVELAAVHDFYLPLINGNLPNNISSGQYKLRIRATAGFDNNIGDYNEVILETDFFTVSNASITPSISFNSAFPDDNNEIYLNCLDNLSSDDYSPFIGSLSQSINSETSIIPNAGADYLQFQILGFSNSNTYEVTLYDYSANTSEILTPFAPSFYNVPDDLGIGTYTIQVEEVLPTGVSNYISTAFLWHSNAKVLTNQSATSVCTTDEVTLSISTDSTNGIGRNYMGSFYEIDFDDGTNTYLTQADIICENSFQHQFTEASCNLEDSNLYEVSEFIYNKFEICDQYTPNGEGLFINVDASSPPQPDFSIPSEQCINNENLQITNTTTPGQYSPNSDPFSDDCLTDFESIWQVLLPGATDYVSISNSFSSWITDFDSDGDTDLAVPLSALQAFGPGCWTFQLTTNNANDIFCDSPDIIQKVVEMLEFPEPSFDIEDSSGNVVNQICPDDIVNLVDTSGITDSDCQDPSWLWEINPGIDGTEYTFINNTTPSSQNPEVVFSQPGIYDIELTISNGICNPPQSVIQTLIVEGPPTVDLNPNGNDSDQLCLENTELPFIIDFSNVYTPLYGETPFAPSTYEWIITGNGVTNSDYEFIQGTTNSDAFPIIQFNSFLDYVISITVVNNCDDSASDSLILLLNEIPEITNTDLTQEICSGEDTEEIILTSSVENTSYTWVVSSADTFISGYQQSGDGNIPSQTLINSSNVSGQVIFTVTPSTPDCQGETQDFTITINPVPSIDDINEEICTGSTFLITPVNGIIPDDTTYSWGDPESNPQGAITGGTDGNNELSISDNLVNITTSPAVLTYIVTPTTPDCQGEEFNIFVTVNPDGQVNPIQSQSLCNGEATQDIIFDTENSGGTTTYAWTNDTPSIGLAASGTGDISSFVAVNTGTSPVIATIEVIPIPSDNTIECDPIPETFTITVNPSVSMFDPADEIICNGDQLSVDFDSPNTGGSITYSWTNDTTSIGLAASGTDNISFNAINTGTTPVIATIEVTPTFTNGGISSDGPSETFTITVNPTGQVDDPTDQVVCNGELTDVVFTTQNTDGTTTYAWTNDTPSIGLTTPGSGDISSFVAINTGTTPVIATIEVTPSFEGCEGPSETFTITVNPTSQVDDPTDQVVCNGDVTQDIIFTTQNTDGTTTYAWTNDTTSIGLAASGTGDISSFVAINEGTTPVVATIEVTPLFANDGVPCEGPSETFTITVNPGAQVDPIQPQELCNGDQLIVDFTTQNTSSNTTYEWTSNIDIGGGLSGSGNIDFQVVNNGLNAVIATIEVTPTLENQAISCSGSSEIFTVRVNGNVDPQELISDYNGFEISCFGANNGSIDINPIGGTPFNSGNNYTINWTGFELDGITPNGFTSTTLNISNLLPGIYELNITDASNCSFIFEYVIEEPDPLEISTDLSTVLDIPCNGDLTNIFITPIGGAPPYSYLWTLDGQVFSTDEDLFDVGPGTYVLILEDSNIGTANECQPVTEVFVVEEPEPITSTLDSQVDILCNGDATGSIEVTISGGTPTVLNDGSVEYNYSWAGPNSFTSNSEDIFNLFAGTYVLTVTDQLNCSESFTYDIDEPDDLILSWITTDNTCFESNDGTIILTIAGGVGPYQILWSNSANGTTLTNLSAGIYDVEVTDFNGCIEDASIQIFEAPVFETNEVVTQISCFGESDGSIDLNIVGGVPPYNILWDDDPSAGDQRNNLSAGTYSVTITDSSGNNCTIQESWIIIEPQEIVLNGVTTQPLDCNNVNSGAIDLQVVGGTPPYSFLWSNGDTTEDLTGIPAGNYTVTVTDSRGCQELSGPFILTRPSDIETSLDISFDPDCDNHSVNQITTIDVSGGVPPYTINWSSGVVSGSNNQTMTTSQEGAVIVDITDSIGCTTQEVFNVELFELGFPEFEYTSLGLNECQTLAIGDEIQFVNTSTGDYISINWNFGDNSFDVQGENVTHTYNEAGTYVVTQTVEYPYGCVYEYTEIIEVTTGYGIVLPNAFTPNGDGINDTIRPWYNCMSSIELSIYDTFGSLLYVESSTDTIYGWDGTINGKEAENGNYVIVVRAVTLFGKQIELNGPVALIR